MKTKRPDPLPPSSYGASFEQEPSWFLVILAAILFLSIPTCSGLIEIMSQKRDKNPAKHLQYLEPTTTGSAVNGVRG